MSVPTRDGAGRRSLVRVRVGVKGRGRGRIRLRLRLRLRLRARARSRVPHDVPQRELVCLSLPRAALARDDERLRSGAVTRLAHLVRVRG